jgi:hypothetical protein
MNAAADRERDMIAAAAAGNPQGGGPPDAPPVALPAAATAAAPVIIGAAALAQILAAIQQQPPVAAAGAPLHERAGSTRLKAFSSKDAVEWMSWKTHYLEVCEINAWPNIRRVREARAAMAEKAARHTADIVPVYVADCLQPLCYGESDGACVQRDEVHCPHVCRGGRNHESRRWNSYRKRPLLRSP